MTSFKALAQAEFCAQLAGQLSSDPMRRLLLRQMRQLWIKLADKGTPDRNLDAEFIELLDVEAMLIQRPQIAPSLH